MELVNQQQIIFFRLWIDILRELLPSSLLEEFSGKENKYLWIKEALTEIEYDDKQKKYYSGKPKIHRFTNQIVITEKAEEIIDVIVGKRGR